MDVMLIDPQYVPAMLSTIRPILRTHGVADLGRRRRARVNVFTPLGADAALACAK